MSVCADFAFERKLGAGANGSVFHVRRVADQQEYALKQIDGFDELAPPAQATVLREVKLLAAVDHPHVVSYMESFIEDGRLHIVMELCEGGDVHSMLRRRAGALLPESEVWRLYGEALRGLEHLHSLQILHRDVKSMNLFLTADGSLRLGDLGVARQLSPSTAVAHTVIGTPYYLSPELCNGQPYGAKADVSVTPGRLAGAGASFRANLTHAHALAFGHTHKKAHKNTCTRTLWQTCFYRTCHAASPRRNSHLSHPPRPPSPAAPAGVGARCCFV